MKTDCNSFFITGFLIKSVREWTLLRGILFYVSNTVTIKIRRCNAALFQKFLDFPTIFRLASGKKKFQLVLDKFSTRFFGRN